MHIVPLDLLALRFLRAISHRCGMRLVMSFSEAISTFDPGTPNENTNW